MGVCTSQNEAQKLENSEEDYQKLDFNRVSTYQKLENIANNIATQQQIDKIFSSLIQRMIASRQTHILNMLEKMDSKKKQQFMTKLERIDFEFIDSLFHHCYKQNQSDVFSCNVIQSINSLEQNFDMIKVLDDELIFKKHQVGIVLLCGGRSSRLSDKLLSDIGLPSKKCVVQIMMERLKKVIMIASQKKEIVDYPIAIVLSDQNSDKFQMYLKSKRDFGFQQITILLEKSLPVVDINGQVVFEQENQAIMTPEGTGTIFIQLNSFINKFPNMEYIHFFGLDNLVGLPLDPIMLNLICKQKADVLCKVIETNQILDDRIFYSNKQFKTMKEQDQIINQTQMCLNDLYLSVSFLNTLKQNHEKALKLNQRYHSIKRGDNIQFEKHIQDIIEVTDTTILYQTKDYALLIDDPKKAVIQLSNVHKRQLNLEGTQDKDLVEITPQMSYCRIEDLQKIENITYPLII